MTKHSHLTKKKKPFHHNNASAHTSSIEVAKVHCELCFELLPYAPYPPDLAIRDFFSVPKHEEMAGLSARNQSTKEKTNESIFRPLLMKDVL